ncbi:MAG: hypothetical protein ACTS8S_11260 [Giesbergeria sp.]
MKFLRTLYFALALAVPVTGFSHEGEDHGEAPTPSPTAASAPRAEAQTSDFELVVEPEGPSLLLFLDTFSSNAPVTGAEVEVQSGGVQAAATEVGPGTYRVAGGAWTQPGSHALTISVQTSDTADLLSATLDIPAAATPAEKAGTALPAGRSLWMLAGGVLVFAFIAFVWLRRRRTDPS